MFNSSALPPNTPPSMPRSQKEQDAASSLVELQQGFHSMQPNSGMTSPASSPTEFNAHHVDSRQQPHGASAASINSSSQHVSRPTPYQLIMLPSPYRQRESAVRSTLNRSMPIFGQELRREFAIHKDRQHQQGQVQAPPKSQLPQSQYHSVYQVQPPQQASSSSTTTSQARPAAPSPPQISAAQAIAHAQAQAYYLAHARVQTYGYPQQQQPKKQQQPQQHHHHHHRQQQQQQQQQQPIMNHHVRAVEDRRNAQPWPEPNSNRSSKPARPNDPASLQNSFSIRGNGVQIQRSILHQDQQPATPIPSRQHQAVGNTSPQQQQMAPRSQEAMRQLKPIPFYRPNAQHMYNQREVMQHQAYRQHQQAHQQAIHQANQHFKQHHYPLQQHQHQQAMHQSKETARHHREIMAQHESLPHRQPVIQSPPQQQQQQQQQQEQRAITISPTTSPETVLTTEADEDEEMYELEEDDDSYEDDSDADFQGTSKSKRHSGHSSSSGNSNSPRHHCHHHGNNNNNKNNIKKGKSVKEKPRWTAEMRESLLKAVITYKNLDDMTSFHWSQIGKQVGRSGKACKDQWRRALLPKIQHTFDRCEQDFNTGSPTAAAGTSSFPASLQPQQQRNNKQ